MSGIRIEHSQLDFVGVRHRREQPGERQVHILKTLLHESHCRLLWRKNLIPWMNPPGPPFDFEPIAHGLERKRVVGSFRPPIKLEGADHFASSSLLHGIGYEFFQRGNHNAIPTSENRSNELYGPAPGKSLIPTEAAVPCGTLKTLLESLWRGKNCAESPGDVLFGTVDGLVRISFASGEFRAPPIPTAENRSNGARAGLESVADSD